MSTGFYVPNGLDVGTTNIINTSGLFVGGVSDILGPKLNAENTITDNATAICNCWNRITTTLKKTIILPSAAANSGKFIGIIIDPTCIDVQTIQDAAGAYIDYNCVNGTQTGQTTRIMWASEKALLYSNGVYWHKIHGISIPMGSNIFINSSQLFANTTPTLIAMTSVRGGWTSPGSFLTPATPVITIQRPGIYVADLHLGYNNTNATAGRVTSQIYKNGSLIEGSSTRTTASAYYGVVARYQGYLAVGNTLQPYGWYDFGSYTTTTILADGISSSFSVVELPNW